MKILVLEDNFERQEQFKKNLAGHNVEIIDSSKIAIEKFIGEKWDLLFLDHESGENTGYEVAKFLEENQQHMPSNVIVHSLNTVGAQNITNALPSAIHIPFAWTVDNLKKMGLI